MVTFPFINWTNGVLKETIAAIIACSSQIWVGGGFVSMYGMPGVSKELFGWLVATSQIIELMMILPGVWMSSLLGKKAVLQMAAVPSIAAYILLSQADHILDLFIARALQGVSSGLINGVLPLYLTDIATESVRGGLNYIQIVMWYLGITVIYASAPFIPVLPVTLILLGLTLVWSLVMCWVPESPWYYFERGREAKALDSLSWLRGSQDLARREYDTSVSTRIQASWKELVTKQVAVITTIGVLHWAFVPAMLAYSKETFFTLAEDEKSTKGLQLGQAIICFLVSTTSSFFLTTSARRTVLIRSLIIAFVLTLPPAAYLFYFTRYESSSYVYITPLVITLVMLYPIISAMIFHPMTYTLSLEILYRDKHRKISIYLACLSAFLTTLSCCIVPILKDINYDFLNFSILAGTIFIAFIFLFIYLPETKNKHIFEINRLFRS